MVHALPQERLLFLSRALVLLAETVDSAFRINEFSLTGKEWVAGRTNIDVVALGGASLIIRTARTTDGNSLIIRMNIWLHIKLSQLIKRDPLLLAIQRAKSTTSKKAAQARILRIAF